MQLAAGDPRPHRRPRAFQRLADERLQYAHPVADSPTTNVRVMSAQQPDSSSRGQRSITIGRPAGNGPEPGLVAAALPDASATITSAAPAHRFAAGVAQHRPHHLGGQRPAVELQPLAGRLGLAQQLGGGPHPASAARCARRIRPARPRLHAPPGSSRRGPVQHDAVGTQAVGHGRPASPDRRSPRARPSRPPPATPAPGRARASSARSGAAPGSRGRSRSWNTASGATASIRVLSSGLTTMCSPPPTMPSRNGSPSPAAAHGAWPCERSVSP